MAIFIEEAKLLYLGDFYDNTRCEEQEISFKFKRYADKERSIQATEDLPFFSFTTKTKYGSEFEENKDLQIERYAFLDSEGKVQEKFTFESLV